MLITIEDQEEVDVAAKNTTALKLQKILIEIMITLGRGFDSRKYYANNLYICVTSQNTLILEGHEQIIKIRNDHMYYLCMMH